MATCMNGRCVAKKPGTLSKHRNSLYILRVVLKILKTYNAQHGNSAESEATLFAYSLNCQVAVNEETSYLEI